MKQKILLIFLIGLLIAGIAVVSAASGYFNLCLNRGETVFFSQCNPLMPDQFCSSDSCNHCVYIGSKGFYCPASINKCNALGGTCNSLDGNNNGGGTIERIPPEIIGSCTPENNKIYASRYQYVKISATKEVDWYYQLNGNTKWKRLCRDTTLCNKKIRFDEGFNELKIRAIDDAAMYDEKTISFRVDSKKPRIYRTYPRRGFASGTFDVQFKELNPESLVLNYGGKEKDVDLVNDCNLDRRGKTFCSVFVDDLDELHGQRISYNFVLKDIAGSTVVSKRTFLQVDTVAPDLINDNEVSGEEDSFWSQGEGRYNKYIYFDMKLHHLHEFLLSFLELLGLHVFHYPKEDPLSLYL